MKRRYGRFGKFTVLVALVFACQCLYPVRCVFDGDPDIRGAQHELNSILDSGSEDDQFSQYLRYKLGKDSFSGVSNKLGGSKKNKADGNIKVSKSAVTPIGGGSGKRKPGGGKSSKPKKAYPITKTKKPKGPASKKKDKITVEVSVKKVELVVIYESLCPYSRRFVYSQLRPTFAKLAPFINLTMLPFGKAHVSNEKDGQGHDVARISCQHGENECVGNKIETCVLRVVEETITAVQIVACMSENSSPHRAGEQCAKANGVEWKLIDTCVRQHGTEYELQVAQTTWKYKSQVTRVPLVVMDGNQNNYVNYYAQKNLMSIVCDEILMLNNEEPKVCRQERRRRRRRRR